MQGIRVRRHPALAVLLPASIEAAQIAGYLR
jgi:hypothetical protein